MSIRFPAAFFEALVELSPYLTTVTSLEDGRIVYANAAALAGDPEIIGKTSVEIGFWRDHAERLAHIALARRDEGVQRRVGFEDASGPVARVLTSKTLMLGGPEYLVSTLTDITEQLKIETELADALDRLERAQSLSLVGDFITDLRVDQFNGSVECMRLLGLGNEARTVPVAELFRNFHPEDVALVQSAIQKQLPSGEFSVEHRLSGEPERWVNTRATTETLPDGRQIMRGTAQDITQRKLAERERERLLTKIQETQRLESLSLLSGGVAHDFNNLLAGILGNADLALLEEDLPANAARRLREIVTASRRAADLTGQLLAYSGKGRFVIEAIDLTSLVREMSDLLEVNVDKSHALRLSLAAEIPAISGDVTQIRQVVMNLILNASEAIDHNEGLITITSGVQFCDRQYLTKCHAPEEINAGDFVFLEVSDNGVGMTDDTSSHVFDPFFTTKFTGRGLGMAAVLGIVRGHRGTVTVQSELGVGTTFKVLLPATPDAVPAAQSSEQVSKQPLGSGGVLVVDDEMTVRDFLTHALQRFGYTVFTARDGIEGVALFTEHVGDIGLVVLDLTMPGMDGVEVFTRLREIAPDIAVILMSGYDEQEAMQRFEGEAIKVVDEKSVAGGAGRGLNSSPSRTQRSVANTAAGSAASAVDGLGGFLQKPFLVNDLIEMVRVVFPTTG